MVHADVDGDVDGAQNFGKNSANTFAQRECLEGIGLRQQKSKFVATEAECGV
jgi:hypothetical protein